MSSVPIWRTVRLNVIANYVGNGWSGLMGLVFVPVYIGYLGIEAYGLIGLFTSLQTWLTLLDMGLGGSLIREMARLRGGAHTAQSIRNLLRTVETIYIAVAAIAAMLGFVGASWISQHWLHGAQLSETSIASALSITGIVIGFRWIASLYRGAIGGLQEQVWLNVVTILFSSARGAGIVAVLAWVSPTIEAFFIYQGVVAALEAVVLRVLVYRLLPPSEQKTRFRLEALKSISAFAGGTAILAALSLVLSQADKFILSTVLPLDAFGRYALAAAVAGALSMFVFPVSAAVGPKLTEIVARGIEPETASAYHRYVQLMSISLVAPAVVVALFASQLLIVWSGNLTTSVATAPLLSILAVSTLFNGLLSVPMLLQLAYGWVRFTVLANLAAAVILVPALWFISQRYGGVGAALVGAGVNLGLLAVSLPLMHRRLLPGSLTSWYLRDVLPVLAVVLVVCGTLRALTPDPELATRAQNGLILATASFLALGSAMLSSDVGRQLLSDTISRIRVWSRRAVH